MIIPLETFSNFIYENFSNVKCSKNGTHFLARCSLCGDSKTNKLKRRFNSEYNNGEPMYHCFNCGDSGNFIKLYSKIKSISYEEAKKILQKFDKDSIKASFKKTKKINDNIDKKIQSDIKYHDYIINDSLSIDDNIDSIVLKQYQEKLKSFITERKVKNYKLYIAYKGKFKGRIIIPIYNNGHIIFFQGRSLFNDPIKYDNPSSEKSSIILNGENFDRSKYIIITEGIFDALSIGKQGTTCFGASVNDDFILSLLEKTDKGIIIALDNDNKGLEETKRIIDESKYSKNLKYFLMPDKFCIYKDINMLDVDNKIENIYDFIINNSYNKFEYIVSMGLRRKK